VRLELTLRWSPGVGISYLLEEWDAPPEVIGHFTTEADLLSYGEGLGSAVTAILGSLPQEAQPKLAGEVASAVGELLAELAADQVSEQIRASREPPTGREHQEGRG
jgi:hypothetical protein